MRLSRRLSGAELVRRLQRLGYAPSRQTGTHIRLTAQGRGEHHITAPSHDPHRVGSLAAVPAAVTTHHGLSRDELLKLLLRVSDGRCV